MNKFKRLFIISDEKEGKGAEERFTSKFPETIHGAHQTFNSSIAGATVETPTVPTPSAPLECAPHMDGIMKLYETGFSKLNKPGTEFFEFFEAVVETGVDNPAAYKMALKILSKTEKTMTKESLLAQSQYYVDELTKVHSAYDAEGILKRQKLASEQDDERQKLNGDIGVLRDQIQSLKNQLAAKEMQLSQIGERYTPKINDLQCKIMANNEAKNRILGAINAVVNGIKINL